MTDYSNCNTCRRPYIYYPYSQGQCIQCKQHEEHLAALAGPEPHAPLQLPTMEAKDEKMVIIIISVVLVILALIFQSWKILYIPGGIALFVMFLDWSTTSGDQEQ